MTASIAVLNPATHVYTDSTGVKLPLCVSDVLELSGISPEYPETAAMEYARDLGWAVHDWCTYLDSEDGEDSIEGLEGTELVPYILAYQRFRVDYRPKWQHIEQSFSREDCGGTPDRIGLIDVDSKPVKVILDLKTPQRIGKHWQIQLSAYQWLAESKSSELYVLQLGKDAAYKLTRFESDRKTWLAALRVARWKLAR